MRIRLTKAQKRERREFLKQKKRSHCNHCTANGCGSGGFNVDGFVVKKFGLLDLKREGTAIKFLKKTTFVSGVAGSGCLLDFEKKHILVAIHKPANDALGVPASLTLEPEFLSGSAPEGHETGFERIGQRFRVHPRKHQNPSGGPFLA